MIKEQTIERFVLWGEMVVGWTLPGTKLHRHKAWRKLRKSNQPRVIIAGLTLSLVFSGPDLAASARLYRTVP